MCFEPFTTPSRKYGVEFPERSEIRFRKKKKNFDSDGLLGFKGFIGKVENYYI